MALEDVQDIYPLSPLQAGMLFHSIEAPAPGMYVLQIRVTLEGPLDHDVLRAAWDDVVERHEALRASFVWEELDEPLQVVHAGVRTPWTFVDGRRLAADQGSAAIDRWLTDDRLKGFAPADVPLMRVGLVQLGDERHLLAWTLHHLLADAWSIAIVLGELRAAYHARLRGERLSASPAPAFRDFIAWIRARQPDEGMNAWRQYLEGVRETTRIDLGTPPAGTPDGSSAHAVHEQRLPAATADALSQAARACRVTPTALFQVAWASVLSGYAGTRDVVFGTVVSGRSHGLPGADRAVGLYMNTIPVRVRLDASASLRALIQDVHARGIELRPYEHAALGRIQAWSEVPAGSPLFESLLSLLIVENHPSASDDTGGPLVFRDVDPMDQSNYPLAAFVIPGPETRLLVLSDARVVPPDVSERMLSRFATALQALPAHLDASPASLPLMPEAERDRLQALAAGAGLVGEAGPVHERVAAMAVPRAEAVAVTCGSRSMTYRELDAQAATWARRLAAMGVGRGDRVAILLERSCDVVAAMLATLRAGAAYVPLDPGYPAVRTQQVLDDCQPRVLITARTLEHHVAGSVDRLFVDDRDAGGSDAAWDPPAVSTGDPAYVMYTSGSTGRPKGVVITHGNLAYSTAARLAFYADPPASFLMLSSFAFDSSVAGLYWTLASGGTLVVSEPGLEHDVDRLAAAVARHAVTHVLCLPSLYEVLLDLAPPERLRTLRTVIVAGEAFPAGLARRHRSVVPAASLFNEYGPTEACVWCTVADATSFDSGTPASIGRPIPGAEVRLLGPDDRPVPLGADGEIVVGGPGLAHGYLGQPDATARAFGTGPTSGRRFYRTGDLGRYLPDGTIAFLGRRDRQVKIRGHRIETAEIEHVLRAHPAVRDAAVVAVPAATGAAPDDARLALAAFVVPAEAVGAPSPAALRDHVGARLPAFMAPALVTAVPGLPRLPNGKVDYAALRRTAGQPQGAGEPDTPRDDFERTLAEVWREALRVERVGIRDDFFALGGDSITSIRIVALARQRGISIAPSEIFEFPSIAALGATRAAAPLAQHPGGRLSLGPTAAPARDGAPLFMVHGGRRLLMQLTAALQADREVHLLMDHRDGGDLDPLATIGSLANSYLAAVEAARPDGPFVLGGYSIGAPIAVEMARRLRAGGRAPVLVFLLDPPDDPGNFGSAGGFAAARTASASGSGDGRGVPTPVTRARQAFVDVGSVCLGAACRVAGLEMPMRLRRRYVAKVYDRALRRHVLRPYEGPVLIFHSADARRNADGLTLWHFVEGRHAEAVRFDAAHTAFVRDPSIIDDWTRRLAQRLAELDSAGAAAR